MSTQTTDIYRFTPVYALICIVDLVVMQHFPEYRYYTKPLIMISLMGYFWASTEGVSHRAKWLFIAALVFALGGDTFLMWDDWFIFGLLSFMLMQVVYTVCFTDGDNYHGRRELVFGGILALFVGIMNVFLWPHTGDMRIPVIVYTLAIAIMSYMAYTRDLTGVGYSTVWYGTLFFVLSDSLLAINLFVDDLNLGGWTVMMTYVIAQILIVEGFVRYLLAHRR